MFMRLIALLIKMGVMGLRRREHYFMDAVVSAMTQP
jgi:hypothetical protein